MLSRAIIFFSVLAASGSAARPPRGVVIESFDAGFVDLVGYPGQDADPDGWELTATNTFGGTPYALRLYGNTWKTESIPPYSVAEATVWQVAVYAESLGEMQAFGVTDGTYELLYTFSGEQLPQEDKWWTVYQGAFPRDAWYAYLLPIGRDWVATYGYVPTITALIYVNDDDAGPVGATVFDEIIDVTSDLPVAPEALIQYTIEGVRRVAASRYRVGVQFHGKVFDPDSELHFFSWDFGDSAASAESDPFHEFLVESDHTYTVGLVVTDADGLAGHDTCQVRVETGEGEAPVEVNFVGDVMTARAYEAPGGIIDDYGVEWIFEPTRPIFGEAADVSVCNLECSYTDRGVPHPTKSVVFRSRPENIAGIAYAGVDVVDVGNNHIIDYGEEGMLQTEHLLDSLRIGYAGAGKNAYFALQSTFWTERGVRLAFLGQCNRTGREWNYQPFLDAGYNKPGFAYLLPMNLEQAIQDARDLSDAVIVQLHSGDEYEVVPPPAGGALDGPPPVEADEIGAGDPDFTFPVEPTPGDRALRRMAIDLGADIVINHHPHVLQGFESYGGRLIAHSLGNFVFDLYYPETMPTIVLTLELDKEGILGYRIVPAWIDDYVPQPATGRLAREILDRVADYSRPMGALVAVHPDRPAARIYVDRAEADSTVTGAYADVALVNEAGSWISPPIELEGRGNLSRIDAVEGDGLGDLEVRLGRELLWHGGFEAEGATFWALDSSDEWLDDSLSVRGLRSLALRRHAGDGESVATDLEKHLPCDVARAHSLTGWLRAENARDAVASVRFYSSRYASTPIASIDVGPPVTGDRDWFWEWKDVDTPPDGIYFEVRATNDAPAGGVGRAWFDELKLIEWEAWQGGGGPFEVGSPNNYRFVQVRSSGPAPGGVRVTYSETSYSPEVVAVDLPPSRARPVPSLRVWPNPSAAGARIELNGFPEIERAAVSIGIFDVRGRLITAVARGMPGSLAVDGLAWDGRDSRGRALPAGIYFLRVRAGDRTLGTKLLIVR